MPGKQESKKGSETIKAIIDGEVVDIEPFQASRILAKMIMRPSLETLERYLDKPLEDSEERSTRDITGQVHLQAQGLLPED